MKTVLSIFLYLSILLPYLTLLYKEVNIRIRLLFTTLFEILILVILTIVAAYAKNDLLITSLFFYNILVCLSIGLNVFIILLTWIKKKW